MRVRLLAVGTRMPDWVTRGVEEYRKRLPRDFALEIEEISPGARGKNADTRRAMALEAERIRARLKGDEYRVALEVGGKAWSTEQLAEQTERWRLEGRDVALLVGGPDGLEPSLSAQADQRWSLSPLTLPHPLVRILLAEQLYRAWTLMVGHPYHR
ncbi:23S rRNA (pseudouridine(1915)-N(3))-methyltransferase RlmH [Halomonas elongata]|uniref:Ribosomal RNA large subunit methyltransferase H n=1 Tax=Halomonas elongata (strain ATCC 33173 / DSM 2581 / NBRC 15536 / NCIMB 2198 / 1H9) TaxID=768066 RepID=E1VB19_HALED|nr:23S rRNA (pseudouridine(1915)-N(3))-methyltransferase RlmH [Halomonas elongata]MBW5798770.1 23S rRNA (pseudouridine(1915)-N(3))-methyltransferase RlmH [Halomonas elongata]MDL4863652.1 23S rRNA (pseudouridine(1915)-N(3))-methyltransferase RlmH [Halomonas elongata]RAW08766.1 23S rRNA (pseudouridine(1915)-N(3))-methyltransferase RlmH [Halomonas elongata]WBF19352.1 23S rRNA (pseudouridine(1915)-N(3))-methyltransferase RlmH [Halomonas elongata]WPU48212.1 23S rRNA (pseudouridine(1915)-N(3))-methy